ncbi:MAG TPA: DUF6496 domain-containing protein [Candidatus Binataceae bacterium]|nr:DUF6496 domain-containing protein [Candidatus Binataceae bacterium]
MRRAHEDEAEGKAPSTQAGEFVREEIHHVREGKHGARSAKQAIAIGLSKARRAGVKLPAPGSNSSESVRRKAAQDTKKGKQRKKRKPAAKRSRATKGALKREGRQSASPRAMARQARTSASRRTKGSRSAAAKKAARTRARNRTRR